ncbi:MAG: glutamate formimidoyltransferase [Gemmatimonadota bacterium]|nr:glutamate formimidoyltransferase [Gemmatimonadota bacterium]MDH5198119.1 glutamate formimidoyltransferase [Gemmatimonadota bacterium]
MPVSPVLECVPNFSEGRDPTIIEEIVRRISGVDGIKVLSVEPGRATNRTVVTFVGGPEAVVEAAFRGAAAAAELIDMRHHTGEHPRFGALDVCPLVPVAGITMQETVTYARRLGERIGDALGIPVYCYEFAATVPERRNLADVRAGEYEGLAEKLARPEWRPDYGPAELNRRSGATAVGARKFLVAYNVNLNTTSTRRANAIAFDVREKGRIKRAPDPLTGEIVRDAAGAPVWEPGSLKAVKGIGWFIEEYGLAQVSLNLTDLDVTPLHRAFDEVCRAAEARGVRVTGSELVGVVPLAAMLDAGRHFLRKQQRSLGIPDREVLAVAIRSLGLGELRPFDVDEKIIEYAMRPRSARLVDRSVEAFAQETAAESPAPGGGSVAAAVGAFGAALGAMVANLSAHKRGWDARWAEFSEWAERGKRCYDDLLRLVDEDTAAFNRVLAAWGLPKETPDDRSERDAAIQTATRGAIEVPLRVMETALDAMAVARRMAEQGLPSSVSDAGVGALCARAAVRGAGYNARINLPGVRDEAYRREVVARVADLERRAESLEREVLEFVESKIAG